MTLGYIAEWILINRVGEAFAGYDIHKILHELAHCEILLIINDGKLVGVVCAKKDEVKKVLYVFDILSTKEGSIKKMIRFFNENYPGYTLEGKRHNRKRIFKNGIKLERRLK